MALPLVIPRAKRAGSTSSLPLERLLEPVLRPTRFGLVCITAPPGGGKSTAIGHLLTALPSSSRGRFFDADQLENALLAAESSLAVLMCESVDPAIKPLEVFELSPWTPDDCIAYLAGRHREQVGSVMQRLAADNAIAAMNGSPELLAYVMDAMAADASIASWRESLRRLLASLAVPAAMCGRVISYCFLRRGISEPGPGLTPTELAMPPLRWFRHEAVQRLFLGDWIDDALAQGKLPGCLASMSARPLLPEIAAAIPAHDRAKQTLEDLIRDHPRNLAVPMAVSILLAADPSWRPQFGRALNLWGAVLRSARWSGVQLEYAQLIDADCTGADFSGANLAHVEANSVCMADADLRDANLCNARFDEANFVGADLTNAVAREARFLHANLTGAILASADLGKAQLDRAVLRETSAMSAKLCWASLQQVQIEDASFNDADFSGAMLAGASMYKATWDRAVFRGARLLSCNLEGLEVQEADFTDADLTGSLLTGSRMPGGCYNGARLVRAGLAEIEWENADLRGADLTHASFHLGSSRSGLVGSLIPSEGSRTGFYTDEFNEQDYKSPEEIRKASLVGADLRGAKLKDTDFYLVDLRLARYTDAQHAHFVRCGAILVDRAR